MFCCSEECGWLPETGRYMYSPVKNGSIGVCLYIEETNFAFPEHCMSRNATRAEFLRFRYLCVSSCMAGIRRCTVSSAHNNLVGRTIIIIII